MNHLFTLKLRSWLETPADSRDYAAGALLLLQLSGNRILYQNIMANLSAHREDVEYQLQKYYNFRVQDLTHEEVKNMEKKVESIASEHHLATPRKARSRSAAEAEFKSGKRQDHDTLPEEIQALYVENASLLKRMRELHLRLRTLSTEESPCPDSERYPFLKELIDLDKKYHANWDTYDHYVAESTTP